MYLAGRHVGKRNTAQLAMQSYQCSGGCGLGRLGLKDTIEILQAPLCFVMALLSETLSCKS